MKATGRSARVIVPSVLAALAACGCRQQQPPSTANGSKQAPQPTPDLIASPVASKLAPHGEWYADGVLWYDAAGNAAMQLTTAHLEDASTMTPVPGMPMVVRARLKAAPPWATWTAATPDDFGAVTGPAIGVGRCFSLPPRLVGTVEEHDKLLRSHNLRIDLSRQDELSPDGKWNATLAGSSFGTVPGGVILGDTAEWGGPFTVLITSNPIGGPVRVVALGESKGIVNPSVIGWSCDSRFLIVACDDPKPQVWVCTAPQDDSTHKTQGPRAAQREGSRK
jgi:hypothetical protein